MSSMYCSRCFVSQPMDQSTSEQEVTGPGGVPIKLVIHTYHCSICHSFVKSESVHEHGDEAAA